MSEKLPYGEDEKWDDLPLPDSETSWQKMEQLLDKEEKKRRVLPPYTLRGCAAAVLLFGLLFSAAWYFTQPDKKKETAAIKPGSDGIKNEVIKEAAHQKITSVQRDTIAKGANNINDKVIHHTPDSVIGLKEKTGNDKVYSVLRRSGKILTKAKDNLTTKNKINTKTTTKNILSATRKAALTDDDYIIKQKQRHTNDSLIFATTKEQEAVVNNRMKQADNNDKEIPSDTTAQNKSDTGLIKAEDVFKDTISVQPIKNKTIKKYVFSTGMGVQQQIPFNGQSTVPYNYYGRKGSLYDYIPSLYIRLQRNKKWFVQGEFRFGAPQIIKDFSYSRQTKADSFSTSVTTTSLRVKKTYYHQLPLSFNYYVQPNWSLGAGGIYSRFYKAVTEQETRNTNVQSGVETVSKKIVPVRGFTDSFFYKSQVQVFLQTDYQWKRFTLGLRYKTDLQPFIKYTKPDGSVDEEKNQSLEAVLRYRLWQSKKK